MPCNYKSYVKLKGVFPITEVPVPCGRCMYCRIQRSQSWAIRISHEMQTSGNRGVFLTLTYDDEHVPPNGSLVKSDFQKYIKRIRKAGLKFKYYGVGEYGETTHRPHYHAILIGVHYGCHLTHQILTDKWDLGFIKIGDVKSASIYYVTNYICNKWIGDASIDSDNTVLSHSGSSEPLEEAFQVVSQGLGKDFALNHLTVDKTERVMYYKGKKVPLLPYYAKKIEDVQRGSVLKMIMSDIEYLESEEVKKYGLHAIGEQWQRNKKRPVMVDDFINASTEP